MPEFLSQRRHISLIVCLAIMLNVLWPALGQAAMAPGVDAIAGEICSASGNVYSSRAGKKPQPAPVAGQHLKHCALCTSLAGAPPPAPFALRCAIAATATFPAAGYTAPTPPPAWPDARPRAPPSFA